MGFRIHRGIFQKLNAERTAYENTFKIGDDGRIKEVDADGNVTAGYLKVGEQATDADTVDGLHSGSFIRSDADDNVSGHTEWQDGYNIRLGNGADFRMWHDGSHTILRNYNHAAGNIYFQGENTAGTNQGLIYMITDTARSYIKMYENGGEKFRTVSAGIKVTGEVQSTGSIRFLNTGGYGIIRGYNNDNHFIVIRGSVATGTSTLSITGGHRTTFVEHANEASEGWYFVSKASGNYTEMARIDGVGQMYIGGNKVWHQGNDGSNTGLDADKLDGLHSTSFIRTSVLSEAQAGNLITSLGVSGMAYTCDIVLNGDPNTFYPVHFFGGDQNIWRRIIISRNYSWQAPPDWNTATHKGGLLLDWEGNFGGWGGATYSDRLRVFNESYSNMVADMYRTTHSMGYTFFLRGGGDTGALYRIFSDQPIRGRHQTGTPDIAYNTDFFFYTHSNTNYNYPAPAPLSLDQVNRSRIDGLKTMKVSEMDNRYQASGSYLTTTGKAADANLLDGINSTQFLRSDTNDTMGGNLKLRYSNANSDDYRALSFWNSDSCNDYIIKASSSRGVFGRQSFGWHVDAASAFGVYSNGWTKLFGVEGGTGNAFATGTFTSKYLEVASADTSDHWLLKAQSNGVNNSGLWTTSGDVRLLLRDDSGNIRVDLYPDGTSRFYDNVRFDSNAYFYSNVIINESAPTISFLDSSSEDDFYIHVNSNNFYVLRNTNQAENIVDGGWDSPHPLQLEGDTNNAYIFGNLVGSAAFANTGDFSASNHVHRWDEIQDKPTTFAPSAHNHSGVYDPAGTAQSVSDELSPRITAVETSTARNATDLATKANISGSYNQDFAADDMRVDQWFRNTVSGKGLYNDATTQHWYSDGDDYWNIAGGGTFNAIRFRDEYNGTQRGLVGADNSNRIGFLDAGGSWAIRHDNDSGTLFYTDGQTLEFRVGRDKVTGNYGTVQVDTNRSGWGGYSIYGQYVLMSNGSRVGIYNDIDNEWMLQCHRNAQTELYHNGSRKLYTNSGGVNVTGTVTATAFAGDGSALTGISAGAPPVVTTVEGGEESTLASIHFNPGEGVATFTLGDGSTYRLAFAR